jgi:hypothetical protein
MMMVMVAMFFVCLLTTEVVSENPSSGSETQPFMDVLNRVIGPSSTGIFDLNLDPSMEQGFVLANVQNISTKISTANDARLSITASGLPELGYGAGYYLRKYAHMSFAWDRTGGNQVRNSALALQLVCEESKKETEKERKRKKERKKERKR